MNFFFDLNVDETSIVEFSINDNELSACFACS